MNIHPVSSTSSTGLMGTIELNDGSSISQCVLARKGLGAPWVASGSTLQDKINDIQSKILAYDGIALFSRGDDVKVQSVLILGFKQAFYSFYRGKQRLREVYGDCTNGIRMDLVYDVSYVDNCHFWNFLTAGTNGSTPGIANGRSSTNGWHNNQRQGCAFHFHCGGDWSKITNCFEYGYKWGFRISGASWATIQNCGADNQVGQNSSGQNVYHPVNTIGFWIDRRGKNDLLSRDYDASENVKIVNCHSCTRVWCICRWR